MSSSIPPPPPGLNYTALIIPNLDVLIINTVWASILIPLLVLLFFLSGPKIRRTPIFIMNVISVTLGIITGLLDVKLRVSRTIRCPSHCTSYIPQVLAIAYPEAPFERGIQEAYPGLLMCLPIFMDCILAVRLYVVFPPHMTRRSLLALIFIPVLAMKLARIGNTIYFLVKYKLQLDIDPSQNAYATLWETLPCMKIEWLTGLFDNWSV